MLFPCFPGNSRWRDILTVALGQASEGKWYVDTLQLQLASYEVCVACRGLCTVRVRVTRRMPLTFWGDDSSIRDASVQAPQRRPLPALRVSGVSWIIPAGMLVPLLSQAALFREVEWMQVIGVDCESLQLNSCPVRRSDDVSQSVSQPVHSPRSYFEAVQTLLVLAKHSAIDASRKWHDVEAHGVDSTKNISSASWPAALRHLSIGCPRNEQVDLETLPKSLERLVIGCYFDQPIESVAWPVTLEQLTLGGFFDQPIDDVTWPPILTQLTFGAIFNQPITGVRWPASLVRLTFMDFFNQPIAHVVWPDHLLELTFGRRFNKPIVDAEWPPSLRRLVFKGFFNQPIAGVVWPASLQQLAFGDEFDQPIIGVVWPASLQKLSFTRNFNQPIAGVLWPASLQQLAFGGRFNQPISEVVWPASLERLTFGDRFADHTITKVVWRSCLQSLVFGRSFDQPLEGVMWPASLRSDNFLEKSDAVTLPPFAHPPCRGSSYEQGDTIDCPRAMDIFDNPKTTLVQYC